MAIGILAPLVGFTDTLTVAALLAAELLSLATTLLVALLLAALLLVAALLTLLALFADELDGLGVPLLHLRGVAAPPLRPSCWRSQELCCYSPCRRRPCWRFC